MNLAIKGHPTRGRDIIQLLEMLGGRNSNNCTGQYINRIYFMNKYGYIESTDDIKLQLYCATYNLEEFEEKFPYKVGDKVRIPEYESEVRIISMNWDGYEVQYEVFTDESEWYSAEELNNWNKEEFMEEPKELLIGFIKDKDGNMVLNTHKDYEIKEVDGKFMLLKKKPQYPKTYEECCDILDIYPIYNKPNLCICEWHPETREMHERYSKLANLSQKDIAFMILRICRDAYWKIARDWKPDWTSKDQSKFIISIVNKKIRFNEYYFEQKVLAFPTEEMRDAFYENFKELINETKELL